MRHAAPSPCPLPPKAGEGVERKGPSSARHDRVIGRQRMAVTSRATASQQGKRTTMHRRTLLAGTAALAATPLLPARAQAAKTKIVWWHAMTAALGEQVTRIADSVQSEPERGGGSGDLQGRLCRPAERDDRRLARRPGTAPRADLRGRHRHHAGRRQGGEAGLGTGQGNRRHDRPEDLHRRRCAAITAWRTGAWRRCRSTPPPR